MIELINKAEDRKFDDVRTLQNSKFPIVMYGAGSYAEDVSKFLANHDIAVSAYCVDEQWLKPGAKVMDKPVQALESVIKDHDDFLVVIGFADYKKARARLEEVKPGVQSIFIDAPNQFGFFTYDYIVKHEKEFEETYQSLEDQLSKNIFVAFINAKLSGDPTPLYDFANFDQYFSDPMVLTDNEFMVDCGAYDGDTIKSLLAHTDRQYGKIFAFEPNGKNFEKLTDTVQREGLENIELVNKGAWSQSGTIKFKADANMTILGADDGESVEVDAIDTVVRDSKVTLIKMDIEGAELEALKGAEKVIRTHHPKLAICVYHKPEDLITIPQYIKSLYPDYKFYLRHHQYMSWEMVLYAIP